MATAMTSHNRWFSRAADDWRWGVRRLKDPSRTQKDRRVYPSQVIQARHSTMVLAYRDRPSGGGIYRFREGFSFFLANSHNRGATGVAVGTATTGADSSSSGVTTVAAVASEMPSRCARAVRERAVVVHGKPTSGPGFPIHPPRRHMALERGLKGRDKLLKLVQG